MSTLNVYKTILAFDDADQTNAPRLHSIHWNRETVSIPVENSSNLPVSIIPFGTKPVFDGRVILAYDGTTQFSVSLSPLNSNRYRLTWIGGTDPQFRLSRTVAVSGGSLTLTVRTNQTVAVTHTSGAVFGAVEVGDHVFIKGVTTGDTSVFSTLNEGVWVVLSATSTEVVLVRETGSVFEGLTETVSITSSSQFLVYSSTGVQVDNVVGFVSGFAKGLLHNFEVVQVTSKFLEFESIAPLPVQSSVIPGVGSLVVYDSAKRYLYIESDQEVAITINDSSTVVLVPWQAGSKIYPGWCECVGVFYSLAIANRAGQQANVRILSVE